MIRRLLALLLLGCSFGSLRAGGFQLNTHGTRQLGMGHTGTGLCTDAATVFFNPAGMSFLQPGWQFNAGVSLLVPHTIYMERSPGIYHAYMKNHIATPVNVYAAFHPDSSRFAFGLGVYNPYGSSAAWPSDWKGQFIIRSISLETFYIQPSVSYCFTDWLSVGAGFVYATGSFSLEKGVPVQDAQGNYGNAKLEGKASGFGWNAGVYSKIGDHFSAGISMRSGVGVEVKNGTADFTVPGSLAEYFPDGSFTTKLKLPSTISLGLGYTNEKWKFAVDINRTNWSSYDTLRIDFATNTDKLEDVHSARCYKDTYTFRAGANYIADEKVELRGGVYYDLTPVQDGYLTPETPDSDRFGITAGCTFHFTQNISANFFYLYTQGNRRTDTNLETGFSGTYQTMVNAFGAGIACTF